MSEQLAAFEEWWGNRVASAEAKLGAWAAWLHSAEQMMKVQCIRCFTEYYLPKSTMSVDRMESPASGHPVRFRAALPIFSSPLTNAFEAQGAKAVHQSWPEAISQFCGVIDLCRMLEQDLNEVKEVCSVEIDQRMKLEAQVSAAKEIIDRGVDIMESHQVGQWAGVREWLERDTDTYARDTGFALWMKTSMPTQYAMFRDRFDKEHPLPQSLSTMEKP